MASVSSLTAQPLSPGNDFNWIFLVELLVCGILAVFFLFYFNRLFATLLSYGLRAYTWRKYKVFVDIQALQISLLGGRIFFKGVRYHGKNETILVQSGYLTWRYWLRSVRQGDYRRFKKAEGERPLHIRNGHNEKTSDAATVSDRSNEESGEIEEVRELPCRISIFAQGVEWIAYNRSPAYDAILSNTSLHADARTSGLHKKDEENTDRSGFDPKYAESNHHKARLRKKRKPTSTSSVSIRRDSGSEKRVSKLSNDVSSSRRSTKEVEDPLTNLAETASLTESQNTTFPNEESPSLPFALSLLPISIDCQKGAIVLGNENTRVILTTVFDRVKGRIDASHASPLDMYRQLFDFDVAHPVVQMRPNPDFKQRQEEKAEQLESGRQVGVQRRRFGFPHWSTWHWRRKLKFGLQGLIPTFRNSVESFRPISQERDQRRDNLKGSKLPTQDSPWLGLDRYLDEEARDEHAGWGSVEYARFSTLVDCPSINFTFYWDVPGPVVLSPIFNTNTDDLEKPQLADINRSEPPAYGLKIVVRGGIVNYGPWADRTRAEIQNMFFPNPYASVEPAEFLEEGSTRQSTVFNIDIEILAETILRIPLREESKDWQWKGRANATQNASRIRQEKSKKHSRQKSSDQSTLGPDIRPFGWLSLHLSAESTVNFDMDMISRYDGYRNVLRFDLRQTKMTSSVNHDILWRSGPMTGQCDLSNPLSWNALHTWTFDITINTLEMFILRDHMFLLTDLIGDWGSSSTADFWTFVPFHYRLNLVFNDLKLYLNANDSNIINDPSDTDENVFLVLNGHRLDSVVDIPLEKFNPNRNAVSFHADLENTSLQLVTPLWNTHRSFLSDHPVATLKHLTLDGSFNYNSSTSPSLTDSLTLDLSGQSPRIFLHGFLIRYFINVKENYFGDNIHFRTLEEYQGSMLSRDKTAHSAESMSTKKTNDLDVLLTVRAHNASILLPSNLYTRKDNIKLDLLLVESDMRFNNYYSDISAEFNTVEASLESVSTEDLGSYGTVSNVQLYIDGITIYGHRLFGTGPSEPTYVCNWDFDIGDISGECSSVFLKTLILSIRSFAFCLDDDENALPVSTAMTVRDITFLRATLASLQLWSVTENAALLIHSNDISVDFNDRAEDFSAKLEAKVPELVFAAVDRKSATRRRDTDRTPVPTHAYFTCGIDLTMVSRKPKYIEEAMLQQKYVCSHDQRSQRVPWLTKSHDHHGSPLTPKLNKHIPPAMPLPSIPALFEGNSNHSEKLQFRHPHEAPPLNPIRPGSSNHVKGPAWRNNVQSSKMHRARQARSSAKARLSGVTFSSPWLPPHFTLRNVELDSSELPSISNTYDEGFEGSRDDTDGIELHEDSMVGHIAFFCRLRNGLRGFCKPSFAPAMTQCLDELKSRHPADILDDLQIKTISHLLNAVKTKRKPGVTSDVYLKINFIHLRVVNTYSSSRDGNLIEEQDKYDFESENLQLRLRNRKRTIDRPLMDHNPIELVVHLISRQARLTISERAADGQLDKAAVRGTIKDATFWLSRGAQLDAKTQVKTVNIITWSRKVEYLAALIHRTTAIIQSTIAGFNHIASQDTCRLRNLISFLAQSGKNLPDPAFLTRPSYVLRAAGDHLRANDSWKIISRLRFIYRNLTHQDREKLLSQCNAAIVNCPDEAQDNVLSIFDQWRTWDLAHVRNSEVMKSVWGLTSGNDLSLRSHSAPFVVAILVGEVRFLLDPGPKQTEFVVATFNGDAYSQYTQQYIEKQAGASLDLIEITRIQVYCSECALRVNWEVVELIDDTIELFQQRPGPSTTSSVSGNNDNSSQTPRQIHAVFGTDLGTLTLESINLKVALGSKDLKGSVVQNYAESYLGKHSEASMTISSNSASAKIGASTRSLMTWRILQPSVYISVMREERSENESILKSIATCQKLFFDVEEGIMGVLEVFGQIISDEANAISSILSRKSSVSPSLPDSHTSAESRISKWRIHAAFLLEDYGINITIVPNLVYSFTGSVARTSIIPQSRGAMRLNFDLKQQTHLIRSKGSHDLASVTPLKLPPVNGSALIRYADDPLSVVLEAMIEIIQLDGGSVRAWIDTLTRPDVRRVFVDAQREIQKIRSRIEETFSPSPLTTSTKFRTSSTPAFNAKVGCAGLKVQTSAPALYNRGYEAYLDFDLGVVSAHFHNLDRENSAIFQNPQVSVTISQISLGLSRQNGSEKRNYGKVSMGLSLSSVTDRDEPGNMMQFYQIRTEAISIELYAETAALVVDVAEHLQKRIKALDLAPEMRHLSNIRRMTRADIREPVKWKSHDSGSEGSTSSLLFTSKFSVLIRNIQLIWIIDNMTSISPGRQLEDLVFSVRNVDLTTQQANAAKLTIEGLQTQMVPKGEDRSQRSLNSALLPEMVFHVAYISTVADRRLAFQAAGKALDLRLTSDFIVPASIIQDSLATASKELRQANAFQASTTPVTQPKKPLFGSKRLASLLVDVDFAGAVVTMQARPEDKTPKSVFSILKGPKRSKAGRYGQIFQGTSENKVTLRAPGVAFKVEYRDPGNEDPSLNAEVKVAASSNMLDPSVVPLVLEISSSVKEMIGDTDAKSIATETLQSQISIQDGSSTVAPGLLGRCKVNVGVWIRGQEFGLSCQPIAKVAATARFDEIIVTINTVQAPDQERFYALLLSFKSLQAHVQHVYSRESTASFDVNSIVISLMNSKHVSSTTGLSAILKISPVRTSVNVKQLQDFLLFREIWYPAEIRNASSRPAPPPNAEDQPYVVQRYQQVAAAGAFPWNAVVAIEELNVKIDLGQSLGMSEFNIRDLWASSRKNSDWEQNLCVGFENVGLQCTGRMSGFVELQKFKIRTSIKWPQTDDMFKQTPLIQASLGFAGLRVKGSFDYQPFIIADITSFNFLMYNVREPKEDQNDRLVAILDGDKVQVFCTTASASQGVALFQAVERLKQEKQVAYESSIRELDRYLRRKSIYPSGGSTSMLSAVSAPETSSPKAPLSLHTDVVVTLQALKVGAFPSTFLDNTIFKIEAHEAQARFAVSVDDSDRTHSGLGLTLGQLRVALSNVQRPTTPAALGDVAVDDVVSRATGSRGGTILKVPRVVATMQTWQAASAQLSTRIDYIFKSSFEGKVDVGWNYARISFIRGMWSTHSRTLSHRLGKPLPQSAVQITGAPPPLSTSDSPEKAKQREQEKITAVVNVPQSRFQYTALEPPIIETPQLRDMGEATPPLEWIGLQRERLPNLTHQIIIVGLLEVCREVEEAYGRILGRN